MGKCLSCQRRSVIETIVDDTPLPIELAPNKLQVHIPEPVRAARRNVCGGLCAEVTDSFSLNQSVLTYRVN